MTDKRHEYGDYDEDAGGCAPGCAIGVTAALLAVIAAVVLLSSSCTRTAYVPVETVRTEYAEADTAAIYDRLSRFFESMREKETRSDSIVDRSRETVVLNERGDTTRHDLERIIYRSTNREKELEHKVSEQDSIINALRLQLTSLKADSVQAPCPVERELSRWERVKMDAGGIALGAVAVIAVAAVWWLVRRRKGK